MIHGPRSESVKLSRLTKVVKPLAAIRMRNDETLVLEGRNEMLSIPPEPGHVMVNVHSSSSLGNIVLPCLIAPPRVLLRAPGMTETWKQEILKV